MDEKQTNKPITGCLIVTVILAAIAFYPLSAGPAVKLVNNDLMSVDLFLRFYYPLMRLDEQFPQHRRPFQSYIGRWADPPPNPLK